MQGYAGLVPREDKLFCEWLYSCDAILMSVYNITPSQVTALCKSKFHYYLFMVVLVGKKKIIRTDLSKSFKDILTIDAVINDLLNSALFKEDGQYVSCISFNVKFPSIKVNPQLENYYKQLDIWDLQFPETFKFENLVSKVYIKKISPRTLVTVQALLDQAITQISSEINLENDSDLDSESQIVHLQIVFNKGNINL